MLELVRVLVRILAARVCLKRQKPISAELVVPLFAAIF